MSKKTITTIILDAAIILAVSLFMFVIRPWDKADKVETDYTPAPELSIAEQEGVEPREPVVGNSKAIDVEPVEGIRITAAANALDKDREFKITAVDEKTWEEAEKKVAEVSGEKMLFCFDLDAGMAPEDHIPGEYTVSMDLKKMGIPPSLYDYISVWRKTDDQLQKYCTTIENDKLTYRSDQNSLILASIGAFVLESTKLVATGYVVSWVFANLFDSDYAFDCNTLVKLKHPSGDHDIYWQFQLSEYGDRYEEWKTRKSDLKKRMAELEKLADEQYELEMNNRYGEGGMSWLKEWGNKRSKEAIDRSAILVSLCENDTKLKEIKDLMELPPSILDVGRQLILANQFLTNNQELTAPFWNVPVYLVDNVLLDGTMGRLQNPLLTTPYIQANYERMINHRKTYVRKGLGEGMLLTLTHELFHYRQRKSQWVTNIDFRTKETTAAYQENASFEYFSSRGEITTKRDEQPDASALEFAGRGKYEVFGRSFNKNISEFRGSEGADESYTYADFMDYLHARTKTPKYLKGGYLIKNYSDWDSFMDLYKKWFKIKEDSVFVSYLRDFCVENLDKISSRQGSKDNISDKALATQSIIVSQDHPIAESKTTKDGLLMQTVDIEEPVGKNIPFHAFIIPDSGCSKSGVTFYDVSSKKESLYYTTKSKGRVTHWVAYFKAKSNWFSGPSFTIVALFQPEKPEITKVKKNYIKFKVPKPEKALEKDKYVTGALYTCKFPDGSEKKIMANPKKFGKEVKWMMEDADKSDFTLTVRWVCEKDGKVYESPESKEAVYGAKPVAPENKAEDSVKDKKPKEEKKAEEKVVKHDNQDKLVEEERYIENPFERISISTSSLPNGAVPECKVPIKITERRANAMDLNAPNGLGRPSTYLTYDWKFTEENSEIKIASRGEEYLLSIKSTQTKSFSNKSWSTWLRGSPDQTYDFNIELIFNEELELVSGKVKENAVFYMEIEPYYYVIEKGKHGSNVERWKDDGKGLRWEKCTYEATYSFVDNRDARHFSINDYSMKAITKEHERNSPNVATFEWSAGKEDLAASYTDVMISLDKKK